MSLATQDWLLEQLPSSLRAVGPQQLSWPQQLPWWQGLGLPLLGVCAAALAIPLSRVTRALLARLLQRERRPELDQRRQRESGPLLLGWATLLFALALSWLRLHEQASAAVHVGIRAAGLLAFYWALSRGIDVRRELWSHSQWGKALSKRSLLTLGAKVGKVSIVVLAVMAFLSELGYAVTRLVAGLGIGGVAVALGARKTLEDLPGAFAIGADQPLIQGDAVRVGDVSGTVEVVGLRSTRIRTQERTLGTIPNGKLADQQIESLGYLQQPAYVQQLASQLQQPAHVPHAAVPPHSQPAGDT